MGTRADFYVGIGPDAEWLGSIAWDGYPDGVFHADILRDDYLYAGHGDEALWREDVIDFLASRDDATLPTQGWPWPWETSSTTDYAYAYDPQGQRVLGSQFGSYWFEVALDIPKDDEGCGDGSINRDDIGMPDFPDMSSRRSRLPVGKRSGTIQIGLGPSGFGILRDPGES